MGHIVIHFAWEIGKVSVQNAQRLLSGQRRGQMALRMVFRQIDDVVEIAGGQHHQTVGLTACHNLLRGFPDAAKMRDIMRFVILIPALMQPVFKTLLPVGERHSVSFYAGQSGFFCNADHKISMLYALLRGRLSACVTNR